jgi:hypothetical protein
MSTVTAIKTIKKLNIVDKMLILLDEKIGKHESQYFSQLINDHLEEYVKLPIGELSDEDQIKVMNDFWRNFLFDLPNTIGLRVWLVNTYSLNNYIEIFEQHIVKKLASYITLSNVNKIILNKG